MITKRELQKIGKGSQLHLYQLEKEYLLKLFLYFYYQRFEDAVFKGGTALRFLFGLDRFSEDLDFNIQSPETFENQLGKVLSDMKKIGINNSLLKKEIFEGAFTCEIGFSGPLFTGNIQTRNKFRIDAGIRAGTLETPKWQLIESEYPETKHRFPVKMMSPQEILSEKIIALSERHKGRDLYDVWFLIKSDVEVDGELLDKKGKFDSIVSKDEYERDISNLTNVLIPYEQVSEEVMQKLFKKQ